MKIIKGFLILIVSPNTPEIKVRLLLAVNIIKKSRNLLSFLTVSDSSDSDDDNAAVAYVRRNIRDRINFDVHDKYFVERFRLSAEFVDFLEVRLQDSLSYRSERNRFLTVRQQILICLRFLADNGFFHLTGDAHGVSKATVHRCVKRVVEAVNNILYNELVLWPNRNTLTALTQRYYEMAGKSVTYHVSYGYLKW